MWLKSLFLLLVTCANASATDVMSVVRHFDMRNCNESRCVRVEAARAESGAYTPMLSLREVQITLVQGSKKTHYKAAYGFVDLDNKRAVFRISPTKELSLNLADIQTHEFYL